MDSSPADTTSARAVELLGQILERIDGIEQRQRELDARLAAIEAVESPHAAPVAATEPTAASSDEPPARTLSRRLLLTGAAGLTAAGVAVVTGASPAAATDGQPILAGQNNTATAATTINASGSATSALDAINANATGAAIYAQTAGASPFSGPAYLGAIIGNSQSQRGVVGLSRYSRGVHGQSETDIGVNGESGGTGVRGVGTGIGVGGASVSGTAVHAMSDHVPLHLTSYGLNRPAPTGDSTLHRAGDLVVESSGALWYCIADGTPGTWRRLASAATAGSFHVLPAPARIYDSRPGTSPSAGPKTKLSATPRTLSCNVNGSGVPVGATAVALTVLLVNAANGNGNMTVWANGKAQPAANTMVWGAGSGRFTSSTISAVDAQTRIQVAASAATDLVLDVVGYYR